MLIPGGLSVFAKLFYVEAVQGLLKGADTEPVCRLYELNGG